MSLATDHDAGSDEPASSATPDSSSGVQTLERQDETGQGAGDETGQKTGHGIGDETGAGDETGQKTGHGIGDEDERQDEIGDVIVKAQQFADETALEAHNRALAVVEEARAEAARIVNEARLQAGVLATQQRVVVPAEAVAELFATIDGFTRTNQELVAELTLLRSVLTVDPA